MVSNNLANPFSGAVTIVPITLTKLEKTYPFEVLLPLGTGGLAKSSKAKADQIRTIDRARLGKKPGALDKTTLAKLNRAIRIHLDL